MLMASAPPPLTAKYPPQDLPLPKVLPSRQGTRSLPDLLKQVMPAPPPSPEVFPQEVLLLPSDSAYQPETRFLPEDWRSPEDPISPEMSVSGQPHPAHALPSKAPDSLTPPPLLNAADSTLTAASWLQAPSAFILKTPRLRDCRLTRMEISALALPTRKRRAAVFLV